MSYMQYVKENVTELQKAYERIPENLKRDRHEDSGKESTSVKTSSNKEKQDKKSC